MKLPPVDPCYLVTERNPSRLHEYAGGLLSHLLNIRRGKPKYGYPIETVKAATVWLLEAYANAKVAPSPEAARLIREIIAPKKMASTAPVRASSLEAYWAAIAFEARHPPKSGAPSSASRYAIAKSIRPKLQNKRASQRTAEATVRNWQKLPHYRSNVALQRTVKT